MLYTLISSMSGCTYSLKLFPNDRFFFFENFFLSILFYFQSRRRNIFSHFGLLEMSQLEIEPQVNTLHKISLFNLLIRFRLNGR